MDFGPLQRATEAVQASIEVLVDENIRLTEENKRLRDEVEEHGEVLDRTTRFDCYKNANGTFMVTQIVTTTLLAGVCASYDEAALLLFRLADQNETTE